MRCRAKVNASCHSGSNLSRRFGVPREVIPARISQKAKPLQMDAPILEKVNPYDHYTDRVKCLPRYRDIKSRGIIGLYKEAI